MDKPAILDLMKALGASKVRAFHKFVQSSCLFAPWKHDGGTDTTPSMSIFVEPAGKSGYNCFTCKEKGTLTAMLQKLSVLGHPKAGELVDSVAEAERDGVLRALPEVLAKYDWGRPAKPKERTWPEEELEPFVGQVPRYATERGISLEVCKRLQLGYDQRAPRMNVMDRVVWDSKRLVFPVRRKEDGGLVGLAGRAIDDEIDPRYWNYWNFNKRLFLFGEHLLELPYKHVLVVEGFMDVARLMSIGVRNVVALMGSKPSDEQITKLKGYGAQADVYVMLDGNEAGQEGTAVLLRGLKGNVRLHTIGLEEGLEPEHLNFDQVTKRLEGADLVL